MRPLLLAAAALIIGGSATAQDAPDRPAILAAIDRYFDGMRNRDTALMAAHSHPGAMTAAVSYRGGRPAVRGGPSAATRAAIAGMRAGPSERLLAAEVWQDGDLAAVWAPYEIRLADSVLHCGFDAFNLVRADGRWQLAGSSYTARPEGCPDVRRAAAGPLPLPPPSAADRQAVMAVVDSFVAALRRRDTVLIASLFSPRATWTVVSYQGGAASINRRPASADVAILARATEPLDERIADAVVRIDGDVAMVWGPYSFRVGERRTHCGVDAFHLTRDAGRWLLEGGAYTVRPDGCPTLIPASAPLSLPVTPPDAVVPYGAEPRQVGELRVPPGRGPFPVVVMIHGGCWQRPFASMDHTAAAASALRELGIATWNIEYRTADETGWPGTFLDVADGVDHLRVLARSHPIDTSRVVVAGHSAGGHLALWAAARPRVPAGSPIRRGSPLAVDGAVAIGPVMDLDEAAARIGGTCGRGAAMVAGGSAAEVPDHHAAGSPINLLPLGVPHAIVVGELDGIMPAVPREDYVRRARLAGDQVSLVVIPGTGHFEGVAPGSKAWPFVVGEIRRLLGMP